MKKVFLIILILNILILKSLGSQNNIYSVKTFDDTYTTDFIKVLKGTSIKIDIKNNKIESTDKRFKDLTIIFKNYSNKPKNNELGQSIYLGRITQYDTEIIKSKTKLVIEKFYSLNISDIKYEFYDYTNYKPTNINKLLTGKYSQGSTITIRLKAYNSDILSTHLNSMQILLKKLKLISPHDKLTILNVNLRKIGEITIDKD